MTPAFDPLARTGHVRGSTLADGGNARSKLPGALAGSANGLLRSSSAPTLPKVSRCCPADGWSSAPSPGLDGAEGWPSTGGNPPPPPRPGSTYPTSTSQPAALQGNATLDRVSSRALRNPKRSVSCRPESSHFPRAWRKRQLCSRAFCHSLTVSDCLSANYAELFGWIKKLFIWNISFNWNIILYPSLYNGAVC